MLVAGCHKRHEGFTRMAHCDHWQAFLSGGCIMFGNELLKPGPRLIQITPNPADIHRRADAIGKHAQRFTQRVNFDLRQPAPIRSHGVMEDVIATVGDGKDHQRRADIGIVERLFGTTLQLRHSAEQRLHSGNTLIFRQPIGLLVLEMLNPRNIGDQTHPLVVEIAEPVRLRYEKVPQAHRSSEKRPFRVVR